MKKKIIKTCIIFGLVVALVGIPNIPADYPEYITNLNSIFLSNAEELVEVQMNRWVGNELNATIENWTLAELNEFLEDIDIVNISDTEIEFIPGSMSADQTFTVMVSYGFIESDSEDLEAYYEAYPECLESNASVIQVVTTMQQKGFIPQGKDIVDIYEFLEDKYYEYEEDIEDWLEENCSDLEEEDFISYEERFVRGGIGGNIDYYRWPKLMRGFLVIQRLDSELGCRLSFTHWIPFDRDYFVDSDDMTMINSIWVGGFVPPIRTGFNYLPRICFGWAWSTQIYDME